MSLESILQDAWEMTRAIQAQGKQRLELNPGFKLDAESQTLIDRCERLTMSCQEALRALRQPAAPTPTPRKQALAFSPRARISGGKLHAPVYRYRLRSHRQGEERPWQYLDLPDDESAINLWNSLGAFEAQPVTANTIRDAIEDAYWIAREMKGFRLVDQMCARLGYRRCSRRRDWTALDRKTGRLLKSGTSAQGGKESGNG